MIKFQSKKNYSLLIHPKQNHGQRRRRMSSNVSDEAGDEDVISSNRGASRWW